LYFCVKNSTKFAWRFPKFAFKKIIQVSRGQDFRLMRGATKAVIMIIMN
jgi:hypothetical protein